MITSHSSQCCPSLFFSKQSSYSYITVLSGERGREEEREREREEGERERDGRQLLGEAFTVPGSTILLSEAGSHISVHQILQTFREKDKCTNIRGGACTAP